MAAGDMQPHVPAGGRKDGGSGVSDLVVMSVTTTHCLKRQDRGKRSSKQSDCCEGYNRYNFASALTSMAHVTKSKKQGINSSMLLFHES